MTDASDSYDRVAEPYAELVSGGLDALPLEGHLVDYFAHQVIEGGGGPVLDVACGPRSLTRGLASRGLAVSGIDTNRAASDGVLNWSATDPTLDEPSGTYAAISKPSARTAARARRRHTAIPSAGRAESVAERRARLLATTDEGTSDTAESSPCLERLTWRHPFRVYVGVVASGSAAQTPVRP